MEEIKGIAAIGAGLSAVGAGIGIGLIGGKALDQEETFSAMFVN